MWNFQPLMLRSSELLRELLTFQCSQKEFVEQLKNEFEQNPKLFETRFEMGGTFWHALIQALAEKKHDYIVHDLIEALCEKIPAFRELSEICDENQCTIIHCIIAKNQQSIIDAIMKPNNIFDDTLRLIVRKKPQLLIIPNQNGETPSQYARNIKAEWAVKILEEEALLAQMSFAHSNESLLSHSFSTLSLNTFPDHHDIEFDVDYNEHIKKHIPIFYKHTHKKTTFNFIDNATESTQKKKKNDSYIKNFALSACYKNHPLKRPLCLLKTQA